MSLVVPGSTVDRRMTVKGVVLPLNARPISATTVRMWSSSMLPSARLGVPTQIKAASDCSTAATESSVASSLPEATPEAIRSSSPGSRIGARPELKISTFSRLESTPTTSWPSSARQADVTDPT